jgi:mono/diheme cytochrome c family protein
MKAVLVVALMLVSLAALGGCDRDAMMSSRGFRLPEGDPVAGRDAFLYMQCNQCHTIDGEELPVIPGQEPPYVELGGKVTQVRTYGQLITSIINPSHELAKGYAEQVISENGESRMYIYNEHMTVQELIDIVMFLQPHYDVVIPQTKYRVYPR